MYEVLLEAYAYPEHYFKYREVPEDEDCITIKNGETLKLVPVLDAPADYARYVKNAKETESIKKSNSF